MTIHTVKNGERIEDIARKHGVSAELIIRNNDLTTEPTVGDELLILTPTRTHIAGRHDTPERLLLRFGISKRSLLSCNPGIGERELKMGDTVVIKYSEPAYGMGASCGEVYRGYDEKRLRAALPYLTYLSVSSAVIEDNIREIFDDRRVVDLALSSDKIPLLRLCDKKIGRKYGEKSEREALAERIVGFAADKGYRGIVLSRVDDAEGVADFLMEMRKRMLGCDLILLTEINEKSPSYMSDLADGSIFSYSAFPSEKDHGDVWRAYEKFAEECECAKTLIALPVFARYKDEYVPLEEALHTARKRRYEIKHDGMTASFSDGGADCHFPSLKSIKATLDKIHEYGFMGASFDVSRTPTAYFAAYNALFRPAIYTAVRAPEGCSRES